MYHVILLLITYCYNKLLLLCGADGSHVHRGPGQASGHEALEGTSKGASEDKGLECTIRGAANASKTGAAEPQTSRTMQRGPQLSRSTQGLT